MEGELTSVKVSQDSRYALINRALDAVTVLSVRVRTALGCERADVSHVAVAAGNSSVGDQHREDGAQVHGPQATASRYTQWIWRRGREFCHHWQRRYIYLMILELALSSPDN